MVSASDTRTKELAPQAERALQSLDARSAFGLSRGPETHE